MKYVIRILGFPFFAALAFIGVIVLWVRYMSNYVKHGGEAIAYTNLTSKKTIKDVYEKLVESQQEAK